MAEFWYFFPYHKPPPWEAVRKAKLALCQLSLALSELIESGDFLSSHFPYADADLALNYRALFDYRRLGESRLLANCRFAGSAKDVLGNTPACGHPAGTAPECQPRPQHT